jgi:cell division protein FtsL
MHKKQIVLLLLVLLLCDCKRRRRVNAVTIPNDKPIVVKIDEPERMMARFEEILFYTVIIISFIAAVIQAIRFEINKYKNNNDIDKINKDLRDITAIIGERNSTRRQEELRRDREIINNLRKNNFNKKSYDNDNNFINDGELESLVIPPSGSSNNN